MDGHFLVAVGQNTRERRIARVEQAALREAIRSAIDNDITYCQMAVFVSIVSFSACCKPAARYLFAGPVIIYVIVLTYRAALQQFAIGVVKGIDHTVKLALYGSILHPVDLQFGYVFAGGVSQEMAITIGAIPRIGVGVGTGLDPAIRPQHTSPVVESNVIEIAL